MAKRPPASSVVLRSAGIQLMIASLALGALVFLAYVEREVFATQETVAEEVAPPVEIGIEYAAPVKISFTFARKGTAGIVKVMGDAATPVMISLPQDWKRTEVYGANLNEVTSEAPAFGFVRWTIPAGAGMRLSAPVIPHSLTLISPSDDVAAVSIHAIDLLTDEQFDVIKLLQVQTDVELWEMNNEQ